MKKILLAAALLLCACNDETITGQTMNETWGLTRLDGTAPAVDITLTFPEKGRIEGQAPCNSYSATQTAPLPWFSLGPIRSTRRACPELALESRYLTTLSEITLIEHAGDTLLLSDDTGLRLEFIRQGS